MTDEDFKLWFNQERLDQLQIEVAIHIYICSAASVTRMARKLADKGMSFNDIIYAVQEIGKLIHDTDEDEC